MQINSVPELKANAHLVLPGVATSIIDYVLPVLEAILANLNTPVSWTPLVDALMTGAPGGVEGVLEAEIAAVPQILPGNTVDQKILDAGLDAALAGWTFFHPTPAPAPAA